MGSFYNPVEAEPRRRKMKSIHNVSRFVLFCATIATVALFPRLSKATPYASCISNNATAQTVTFYLNESGGNAVVTYNDGTTNVNFNGLTTGTNLPSGAYTFSLAGETTYSIAVTKYGTGTPGMIPNVIQNTNTSVFSTNRVLFGAGDPRGLAVNVNPVSPYFGRIYISRGGNASVGFFDLNSDGTPSTAGAAGTNAGITTFATASPYSSPNRISIAPNDLLVVGDWSINNAGVWLVDPNLATNELLLGPVGDSAGKGAGVHGAEVSPPVLLGDLDSGATLMVVDSDLTTPNSLLVYSNITASSLSAGTGWQSAPSYVGPEVAINYGSAPGAGVYLYPSLCVGTNGYIYAGEYRGGVSAGDPAAVQIYDSTVHTQLWTSRYNGGSSDYFFTAPAGGTAVNPTGLSISPDGKYLAAVGIDNHFTVCLLTNGIPDVSTIFTIKPDRIGSQLSDGGAEVAWDAADNLYILSGFNYGLKTWTLGQSAVATTIGTASGVTSFDLVSLIPTIGIYATNNGAISQANTYGNPTNGTFTLVRSGGNISAPLTINFTYSGTATNGTYTAGATGSVVLAAGQTTTNINIATVTDGVPRLTTFLTLTVTPSPVNYGVVGSGSATITVLNTAEDEMIASVGAASMYNAFSNDYASVKITRLGDTNATVTVSSFTLAGTAVEGTDYTVPTPVTFTPGALTETAYIYPLNNGQAPTHSTTLPFTGNKTVVVGIGSSSGYTATAATATLTIVDSAVPPETVLFADPLSDPADAANWGINSGNDYMGVITPPDTDVVFGQDLTATPNYAIPFPPNGSQYALSMTVNKSGGINGGGDNAATAVNAYMTNQIFSGNYAVRFNMNVIEGDCSSLEIGSTDPEEGPIFGINHNGIETNLFFPNGTQSGAGQTNWAADGVWYWVGDSGGRYDDTTYAAYTSFTGNGSPATNAGWSLVSSASKTSFATAFKTNVFTSYASANIPPNYNGGWTEGGPGVPANGSGTLGFGVGSWSDVEIKQLNGVVTLAIDKTPIFVYTNTTIFTNGFLMLGYEDPYDGGEQPDTAVYYSNLRVVSIGGPVVQNISSAGGNVVMNFSITDDGSSFSVFSATNVTGPYTSTAATITPTGNGTFQVTVPQNGPVRFYKILQQ